MAKAAQLDAAIRGNGSDDGRGSSGDDDDGALPAPGAIVTRRRFLIGGGSRSGAVVAMNGNQASSGTFVVGGGNKDEEEEDGPPAAVDELLRLVGLESVKHAVIAMYHRAQIAREQGSTGATTYNARFEGNPGTGKTTVARLYAAFLRQLGVLPRKAVFLETSGAKLAGDADELTGLLKKIKVAGGGVLFVDEAYQLDPETPGGGRKVQ